MASALVWHLKTEQLKTGLADGRQVRLDEHTDVQTLEQSQSYVLLHGSLCATLLSAYAK